MSGISQPDSREIGSGYVDVELRQVLPMPILAPAALTSQGNRFKTRWFSATAYKVLFLLVILTNITILTTLWRSRLLSPPQSLNAVSTNIFIAVLIRQEDILNILFTLLSRVPPSAPLVIRQHLADLHHYGGLHTGCAVSAVLWYLSYVVLSTQVLIKDLGNLTTLRYLDAATCFLFIALLLLICLPAYPRLRIRWHNTFEISHRFGGWAAVAVFWIHACTTSLSVDGPPMRANPSLYLLWLTTMLLVLPWLRIRRVPVTATLLSPRELSLSFHYTDMPPCSTMRFSTSPLLEWHAFATIPITGSSFPHSPPKAAILIAASGDWTQALIARPPQTLWIRDPPTRNFLQLVRMWRRVLFVATGAGIGPILSYLGAQPHASSASGSSYADSHNAPRTHNGQIVRILWGTHEPHPKIVQNLLAVDSEAMIMGGIAGRVDIAGLASEVVRGEELEAVFVVSNRKVTGRVLTELKNKGVAAYGATFDS